MNIRVLVVICLGFCGIMNAQELNYLYGYPEYDHINYGTALIKLDSLSKTNTKLNQYSVPFEGSTALIKTNSGDIQLFSNGCAVYSNDGSIIENGDSINPGETHDIMCPNYGYPVPEGLVFLPVPNSTHLFYLVHLGIAEDPKQSYINGPLYYSLIYSDTLTNEHKILQKNIVLSTGNIEAFDIVRHANGRDWWMVSSNFLVNQYKVFLINSSGIKLTKEFTLGNNFHITCNKGTGNIKFSNNGDLLVRWNPKGGLKVLDFDRCSGTLSIKKEFELKPDGRFGGGGISFTKSDKYVYANSQLVLYRINLKDLETAKLDTFIKAPEFWALSLERSFLGPDGNIYFSQMHSNNILPFLYNVESELVKPIKMDFKNLVLSSLSARTSPRFINYQLAKIPGSPCDSLVNTTDLLVSKTFNLYPNPIHNEQCILELNSGLSHAQDYEVMITNIYGMQVYKSSIPAYSYIHRMNLADLPSGVYFCNIIQNGQVLATQKLVVQ